MSNRTLPWQLLLRALYVDVNPLLVSGRLSEAINTILSYHHPGAHADLGTDCRLYLVEVFEHSHARYFLGLLPLLDRLSCNSRQPCFITLKDRFCVLPTFTFLKKGSP